jgi:hypothetical protein
MRSRFAKLRYDKDHYLSTPEGLLAQYRRRDLRRIHLNIENIEPRAKASMPECDKDALQRQVLDVLLRLKRRAFRGPLALRLTLQTTAKTPTQSHTIAKNPL